MPIISNRLRPPRFDLPVGGMLDYGFDLGDEESPYLTDGESIASAEWSAPDGITIPETSPSSGSNPAISGTQLICWLQGDDVGEYDIVASFITSAGREDSAWFRLVVFDPSAL